jgi:hypothetical protein
MLRLLASKGTRNRGSRGRCMSVSAQEVVATTSTFGPDDSSSGRRQDRPQDGGPRTMAILFALLPSSMGRQPASPMPGDASPSTCRLTHAGIPPPTPSAARRQSCQPPCTQGSPSSPRACGSMDAPGRSEDSHEELHPSVASLPHPLRCQEGPQAERGVAAVWHPPTLARSQPLPRIPPPLLLDQLFASCKRRQPSSPAC